MKHQKVVALIILLLSAAFAFTSCNNDGYSLDKFWLEVGTIEKTSDQDYKIILDKGPVLYPSISNVPARYLKITCVCTRILPSCKMQIREVV